MPTEERPDVPNQVGSPAGSRKWLSTPGARWSALALLVVGLLIGAGGIIGTQVIVAATSTNEFCGGACHSMQWVAAEYRQSGHHTNAVGVAAGCHDCHVPDRYPQLLWYKAQAGLHDAIQELRGVISTQDAFKAERLRLAKVVWAEFKENNSANCQHCHQFNAEVIAKQKPFVQPMHQQFLAKAATCIDCHKGIAHTAPDE
jgi:nitrate/TMAO reductase-like tetraheme cytochrome c subunit